MQYKTIYGQSILQILQAYPAGSPGLIAALETICNTAERHGEKNARVSLAANVCEDLHPEEASGLKCLQCHYAETQYVRIAEVEAEMEIVKEQRSAGSVPPQPMEAPQQDDGLSDGELAKVIGELEDELGTTL